jgi:hypothetical protein
MNEIESLDVSIPNRFATQHNIALRLLIAILAGGLRKTFDGIGGARVAIVDHREKDELGFEFSILTAGNSPMALHW